MMHFVFFLFLIDFYFIYVIEFFHILSTLGTVHVDFCCAFFQCYIRVMCLAVMCLKKKNQFLLLIFPYVVHTQRCAGGFLLCFFLALH